MRLGVIKPGLYAMQVRALMEAAVERVKARGKPMVEIMIPLTVTREELALARSWVEEAIAIADHGRRRQEGKLDVTIGTMIETPRAAIRADEIAEEADFFSFGTNDLTQMTFGFSRDDVEGRMMSAYLEQGLLKRNPFETIDQAGVGRAGADGRRSGAAPPSPALKLGVCGEHGGDPESIDLFYRAGLDYVSCSPFRVPIARLASAQAVLTHRARRPAAPPKDQQHHLAHAAGGCDEVGERAARRAHQDRGRPQAGLDHRDRFGGRQGDAEDHDVSVDAAGHVDEIVDRHLRTQMVHPPAVGPQRQRGHRGRQPVLLARQGGDHGDAPRSTTRLWRGAGQDTIADRRCPVLTGDGDQSPRPVVPDPPEGGTDQPVHDRDGRRPALVEPIDHRPGSLFVTDEQRLVEPALLAGPVAYLDDRWGRRRRQAGHAEPFDVGI